MSMEQFDHREPEPNGPIDDPLSHNAHLKVGGLETPCQACAQKDQQLAELKEAYLKVVQIGLQQKQEIAELRDVIRRGMEEMQ